MAPQVTKEEAQWIMNNLNKLELTGFNDAQNLVAIGMKLQSIVAYVDEDAVEERKTTKGK
jgi:hypothetical protein